MNHLLLQMYDDDDSDTQSVPNNRLPVPDLTDPELVPASVQLTVPGGLTATWSLNFPSALRVFQVQHDGTLTPISAGQQFTYDPTGYAGPSDTQFQFEVQGVSAASPAAITATMTPAGAAQPTTAAVNANVVASPLQVLSVKDNVAGAALPAGQQTKAGVIFLPVSSPKDGFEYKLPLNLSVPVKASLHVPASWVVFNSLTEKPLPKAGQNVILDPLTDYRLYIEANDFGGGSAASPVKITLTADDPNLPHTLLGSALVTPFFLSRGAGTDPTSGAGRTDVPQYSNYDYNVQTVSGGKWLSATNGARKGDNPLFVRS